MSTKGKNSKRKIRIPNKYIDTVCELNKKKVNAVMDITTEGSSEFRVSSDDLGENDELGKSDNCAKEGQGLETGDENVCCTQREDSITNGDCAPTVSQIRESSVIGNEKRSMAVNGNNCGQNVDNIGSQCKQVPNSKVSQSSIPVNVQSEAVKTSVGDCVGNENKTSYAYMTKSSQDNMNNKLSHIPTYLTEEGNEVVIFDEDIVKEGSKKWELSACGYFVGYKMYPQELNYHLFRMWGRYGLKSIQYIGNGTYVFKFDSEQGLQTVIENGVWNVNSKPMLVQKWDISVDLNKVEPDVIPIWVKMLNIPLEAWSTKGLSALASRLGKPVIMDAMTTKMCNQGIGRMGYARVLIEVDAKKGLQDYIVIQYCDKDKNKVAEKTVNVLYDWKPPTCNKCKVFGHSNGQCGLAKNNGERKSDNKDDSGYETVKGKRNSIKGDGNQNKVNGQNNVDMNENRRGVKNKYAYIPKAVNKESNNQAVTKDNTKLDSQQTNKVDTTQKTIEKTLDSPKKAWNVQQSVLPEIKTTANKYAVLQDTNGEVVKDGIRNIREEYNVEFPPISASQAQYVALIEEYKRKPDLILLWEKEQILVDKLVNNKKIPTVEETKIWPLRLFMIYKERWEAKWETECPFIGNFQE